MKIFCERLKELRLESNLSTAKLGKEIGVSGPTVSRWENGIMIPSIEHLYNMARFFQVRSDYLIGLEN